MKYQTFIIDDDHSLDLEVYSEEEINQLIEDYKKNKNIETKNNLVKACMPIVISTAKSIYEKDKTIDLNDLISFGFEELIKIVDHYKTQKSFYSHVNKALNRYSLISDDKTNYENADDYDFIDFDFMEKVVDNLTGNGKLNEIIFKRLNERQRCILIDYFGLYGNKPNSLRQLEPKYNLSHEGLRLILLLTIRKVRYNMCKEFKTFSEASRIYVPSDYKYFYQKNINKEEDGYTEQMKDYEGYTKEEFDNSGMSYK